MKHHLSRSLLVLLVASLPSCGTSMFHERQGAEHSGKLDPNVLISVNGPSPRSTPGGR